MRWLQETFSIRLNKGRMNQGWCIGCNKLKQELAAEYSEQKGLMRREKAELKDFNERQREHFVNLALQPLQLDEDQVPGRRFSEAWKPAWPAGGKDLPR